MRTRGLKRTVVVLLSIVLSGCAAIHTSVAKRHLDVQTKMSDPLFLSVPDPGHKQVFIRVRNTSDKTLSIGDALKDALWAKGFTIVSRPKRAPGIERPRGAVV